MMKQLTIALLFMLFCGVQTTFGQDPRDIIIGEKFTLYSDILGEERQCIISLPESYTSPETEKEYPVLILLDGSTHFETVRSTVHFMSSSRNRNYLMDETIIIAIENVDRERDFTVTKIKTKRPNTMGGGRNFLDFIENELIPFIDDHYSTTAHRTLVGHSLGGLLTLNSYMDSSSIFDSFIAIDPSIWWDEEMMKNKVDSVSTISLNKKLYIATANQGEKSYERNKKRHDALYEILVEKSNENLNVAIQYFEDENHRSVPLPAVYEGLKFLNVKN